MVHLLHEHVVGTGKLPVLLSSVSQDPPDPIKQLCAQLDITLLRGAQAAIAAMSKVAGVGRPRWETDTTVVRGQPGAVSSIRTTTWDEHASLGLLEEHGFRTARRRAVTRVDDALDAAATLGYPVVVKGLRKDVLHKQECGLVRLNVTDDRILRNAVDAMQGSEAGQSDTTVLIEEQVHGNVEIFLGMVRDPVFGQVLLLGPGGQWVDIADEIAVSLEPGAEGVATMLDDSVLGQILRRRHDITAASKMLAEAADGLWQLMATNPQILTIDVNPFIVTDDAIVAVDALVVQGGQP
jgi:acyl-CoA synthetase (NDP forming)